MAAVSAVDRLRRVAGTRVRRLRDSGLPVLQCALAAGLAYLVARDLFGHPVPFFAPIACVLVLGVGVTNRLRRSVELAVGVSVGVAVGDLIVVLIGPGWWQISVVVGLALLAALLFDVGALLLNQAAVSAVLVATLQPPGTTAAFSRWIDTLIGATIGLAMAATLPSHPLTRARRGLTELLEELEAVLVGTADALEARDGDAAAAVLERARATQKRVDTLVDAVDAGFEITTIAPLRRRHRGELARLRTAIRPVDLALRNARVLARRGHASVLDGEEPDPDLVLVMRRLAEAVAVLRAGADHGRVHRRRPQRPARHRRARAGAGRGLLGGGGAGAAALDARGPAGGDRHGARRRGGGDGADASGLRRGLSRWDPGGSAQEARRRGAEGVAAGSGSTPCSSSSAAPGTSCRGVAGAVAGARRPAREVRVARAVGTARASNRSSTQARTMIAIGTRMTTASMEAVYPDLPGAMRDRHECARTVVDRSRREVGRSIDRWATPGSGEPRRSPAAPCPRRLRRARG